MHRWIVSEKGTEYKYVMKVTLKNGDVVYRAIFRTDSKDRRKKNLTTKVYPDIRTAAIAVDKWRIEHGKEPINILKPKS